jgi:CO/xanthine dehydrogenase Mo-binding subunit
MTTASVHDSLALGGVGASISRVDAADKLRGRVKYVGDTEVAGMLHGKVLRAEIPHGRIISIDTRVAEAMPGVRAHGRRSG